MLYLLFRNKYKVLCLILIISFLIYANNYFVKTVLNYANINAKYYTSYTIERVIRDEVLEEEDVFNLINVSNKSYGEFSYATINTINSNKLISKVLKGVNNHLSDYNTYNDKNTFSVPVSYFLFRNTAIDFGPNINYKIRPMGSARVNIISSIKEYGINNSLIELELEIEVTYRILLPIKDEDIVIKNRIPLVTKIINGEIPRYYYNSNGKIIPNNPIDDSNIPEGFE